MPTVTSLLATKLYIPRARPKRVARPRFDARLNAAPRLTLICAPPGFGKTTLLSQWIPTSEHCVCWVSLDAGDDDPIRFWTYFIAALQTLRADLAQNALLVLHSSQSPPLEQIATLLLNEVAPFHDHFAVVLDDYQVISSPAIHASVAFLIEHLPPQMRLIMTTRIDPALPLARWRVRGQLTELRAADLRFTPDESATFLNNMMGLQLTVEDIAELDRRTEGWIAGLQLAALSLQGRDRPSDFVAAFTGSHRFILDYLIEEVLDRLPPDTLNFLLQTSILDRLSGSVCDAVTGQSDSQALLEHLEQANLFVVPLDDKREWFRYHQLFADVLRHRLKQSQGDGVASLHGRASLWHEQHGSLDDAVNHALVAQDFNQASRLIEQKSRVMWQRGEVTTLQSWLAALPPDIRRARPQLSLAKAWGAFAVSQISVVEASILEAEAAMSQLAEVEVKPLRAQVDALRSTLANIRQDSAQATELAHRSLAHLTEEDHFLRGHLAYNLGWAYLSRGDLSAASQKLKEAAIFSLSEGDLSTASLALNALGAGLEARGQLREAAACYRQVIQAVQKDGRSLPVTAACGAYVRLGGILYEWNQLEESAQCANQGIELSRPFQASGVVFVGCLVLTRILKAHDDLTGAIGSLRNAETAARSGGISTVTLRMVEAIRAQLWLAQRNIVDAAQWATACERDLNFPAGGDWPNARQLSPIFDYECLTLARVRMAEVRWDEALSLLTRLQPIVEAGTRMTSLIELLALRALALQAQAKSAESVAALERALTLAEPEGYIRTFVDEGEPMQLLIADCRVQIEKRAAHLKSYVEKLLVAFDQAQPVQLEESISSQQSTVSNLIEPLSERELEVLRLIDAGLSNREIAERLIVGLGTIKTHINNLYRKLDVNSRTQAIRAARDLNLM